MINNDEIKNYRYFIRSNGTIIPYHEKYTVGVEKRKEIGNDFSGIEEAEKAVEKLKAWKRLKDNGFKFQFWTSSYSGDNISFFIDWITADSKKEIEQDLDLLFGGEE